MTDPAELTIGERLPRPWLIELGAAILIVGGVLGAIGAIGGAASLPPGTGLLVGATVALNVATIAVGILIRTGRWWIVALNFVAVLGFLDLTAASASPLALLLGILDVVVVLILLVNRPWFEARGRARAEARARARGDERLPARSENPPP